MGTFWNTLNQREKKLILLVVGSVVLLIIYMVWLEPNNRRLNTLRKQIPEKQAELIAIKDRLSRIQPLLSKQKRNKQKPTTSLLSQIEKSASKSGLRKSITRIQPQNDGQVRVWLNDIYFDPWLLWIDTLKQERVELTETAISRSDKNKVNIRVTFKQS